MVSDLVIETGVDKLLSLVKKKKRISFPEAAKSLGVSKEVIEEWADFLEEEGIISIEYKFTTSYLVERKLTGQELKTKTKEFHNKKDTFIRKVNTAIASIDSDGEGLSKFKSEFFDLQKNIGKEIDHVKSELEELEKYEDLKKNIDKDIIKQQADFKKSAAQMHRDIDVEQRRYQDLTSHIDDERKQLELEKKQVHEIEGQEEGLKNRLKAINSLISVIRKKIDSENQSVQLTEKNIGKLEGMVDTIKYNINKKKKKIDVLVKQSEDQEGNISAIQDQVMKKIKKKRSVLKDSSKDKTEFLNKFHQFFEKKSTINRLLTNLDKTRQALRKELVELINRAKAFNFASKSSDLKKHIKELENHYNNLEKKRDLFKKQIGRLTSIVKRK